MLDKLLGSYNVILGSASPRRAELFNMLKIPFTIRLSEIAEDSTEPDPAKQARQNALSKAIAIRALCQPQDIIVCADTIVILDGSILGKPASPMVAKEYLRLLSGKTHTVISAICIHHLDKAHLCHETSHVTFTELSPNEIDAYVASGEPLDKAGAYGIQGLGSQFITGINGCYFNVMGFPIPRFYNQLKDMQARGEL